mmetsp:Transcript_719/g.2957  ORF Transcript_719/g.2957 Transcript_719/m.2957 type:complete len:340 (-) Transcript_719:156-1175(-)
MGPPPLVSGFALLSSGPWAEISVATCLLPFFLGGFVLETELDTGASWATRSPPLPWAPRTCASSILDPLGTWSPDAETTDLLLPCCSGAIFPGASPEASPSATAPLPALAMGSSATLSAVSDPSDDPWLAIPTACLALCNVSEGFRPETCKEVAATKVSKATPPTEFATRPLASSSDVSDPTVFARSPATIADRLLHRVLRGGLWPGSSLATISSATAAVSCSAMHAKFPQELFVPESLSSPLTRPAPATSVASFGLRRFFDGLLPATSLASDSCLTAPPVVVPSPSVSDQAPSPPPSATASVACMLLRRFFFDFLMPGERGASSSANAAVPETASTDV